MTAQKLMMALKSKLQAQPLAELNQSAKISADFSGLRILIADDQAANLKLLSILLHDLHIHVVQATDGQQAASLAEEQSFDLIFMDIQMPQLNGIDACKKIHQTSTLNQHTPIIALTANAQQHEAETLLNDGFSRYLTKPINEAEIHDCILSFCNLAHKLDPSVIDLASSLRLSNNKADLAVDMLQMLLAELPNHSASISELRAAGHWQELQECVHKLHGACCYSAVPTLKSQCQLLENLLDGEPAGEDISAATERLLQAIDKVLKASTGLDIARAIAVLTRK
jgi:two-component system sensor histidine kinase BarA